MTTPCCAVISSTIGQISAILLGAVDEHGVGRNVACEGAEAVAEGPLVAGEAPLAAQGGDAGGAGLSQAPRQGGVDRAAVGLRGLARVDAQRDPDRRVAVAGVRRSAAAARAGRRRALTTAMRSRLATGRASTSGRACSTRRRTCVGPTAIVAMGTLTLRLSSPARWRCPSWMPSTPSSTVAPLAPWRRSRSTTAR